MSMRYRKGDKCGLNDKTCKRNISCDLCAVYDAWVCSGESKED